MNKRFKVDEGGNILVLVEDEWCVCGGPLHEMMLSYMRPKIFVKLPFPVIQSIKKPTGLFWCKVFSNCIVDFWKFNWKGEGRAETISNTMVNDPPQQT